MVIAVSSAVSFALSAIVVVVIAIGSRFVLVLGPRYARTRRSAGRERESDTVRASGPARPPDAKHAMPLAVARPSRRGHIPG